MPKVHKASDPACKRENCQDQGCKCEKQHHVFGRGSSKKTVSKKYDDSGKQVCDYGQMADLFFFFFSKTRIFISERANGAVTYDYQ